MTLQNVKNVLRCTNPLFIFEEKEGNNSNLTSRTITLLADSGLDKLKAAFIGTKGKERLIGVVRQTEYAAGKEPRSEEHTSELQSLMRISYAVFCLKKNKKNK